MKIIFPTQFYRLKRYENKRLLQDGPVFFLAGPILGGDNWQATAYDILSEHAPKNSIVVTPNSLPDFERFYFHNPPVEEKSHFLDQIEWEWYYMTMAEEEGCLIFWLPEESRVSPRRDGYPYAMVTRDEIGTRRMKFSRNRNLNLVMGGEPGFPGLSVIKRYNDLLLSPGVLPIHTTLEKTIMAAIQLANVA
jgi:hypothetical protein